MLKKEEVYVRVSSKKKARKLKDVLDMFNQSQDDLTFYELKSFEAGWLNNQKETPVLVFNDEIWIGGWLSYNENKTKVSLKELRNILAMEYLKEGDVVVCRNKKTSVQHIFEIDSISLDCFGYLSRHSNKDGFSINDGYWSIPSFIRYATEEEKKLLKPQESVIDKAISLLNHGLGLDYSHEVIQGLEELKNK